MITLPNGCKCSNLVVYPKNWQSKKAKININWYIKYRFYDSRYPIPKQVMVKRMNLFKTLSDRQDATQKCLIEEMDKLVNGSFNPFVREVLHSKRIATRDTPMVDSLKLAYNQVSVSERTKRDLKYLIDMIDKAAKHLNLQNLSISDVTRKTVKLILEEISSTADRFNKHRSYLMILLSELCEAEAIDNNPVRDIKKKKIVKHLRTVLTEEERVRVNQHLQDNYPAFHRFLHIFFHSGARISELMRVREYDLDLPNQRYKVIVQKGRSYKEVWKTIKDIVLPFWISLYNECSHGDYLFSIGLKPGQVPIKPYQITKRWYRLVKKKIGIEADFYSLKHLHTTEVVDILNVSEAAKHNEHTSEAMVIGIYDVKGVERKHGKVKGLMNKFA